MIRPILSAFALLSATALPALAIETSKNLDIAAPPAKVWATVGDFCGIGKWHPAIEKCAPGTKDGKPIRTLSLKGGGTIVEQQTARDDAAMSYSYIILEGPLPVANYKSTLALKKSGTGTAATWSGTFDAKGAPDAVAKDAIGGIYESGLKAIADKSK